MVEPSHNHLLDGIQSICEASSEVESFGAILLVVYFILAPIVHTESRRSVLFLETNTIGDDYLNGQVFFRGALKLLSIEETEEN